MIPFLTEQSENLRNDEEEKQYSQDQRQFFIGAINGVIVGNLGPALVRF